MKNQKIIITLFLLGVANILLGVSYGIYIREDISANQALITGDIYMKYTEGNSVINISNMVPMSKSSALLRNDNVFNFQITGKNTSNRPIYYGISLTDGDAVTGKNSINKEDIAIYLTSGQNILFDGNMFTNYNDRYIYVDTIPANTNSYTKDYSLRIWLDESIVVGDLNVGAKYTESQWNNLYASVKVKVDGDFDEKEVIPEVTSCSGCVFAFSTATINYGENGDIITDILTSDEYSENYQTIVSESGKRVFYGMMLDGNDKVTRGFACGIYTDGTPFCIEGSASAYTNNKRTLTKIFGNTYNSVTGVGCYVDNVSNINNVETNCYSTLDTDNKKITASTGDDAEAHVVYDWDYVRASGSSLQYYDD